MKFESTIALVAKGEVIRREVGFWDRFKKVFGKNPSLETDRVQTLMTTAHLLAGVEKTLVSAGITNAIALVIDGKVLFEDKAGRADDVGDLFLAFYENEALYGGEFEEVILTVEHREGGLHFVLELCARGEHKTDESTVEVRVSARVADLEPRPGEGSKAYRERVAVVASSPAFTEGHRLQFESWVGKLRGAVASAMPDVEVSDASVQALVERPETRPAGDAPKRGEPGYDPYRVHRPNPLEDVMTVAFWGAMAGWAWHPSYAVVDASGAVVGTTDTMVHVAAKPAHVGDEPQAAWEDEDSFSADVPDGDGSDGFDDPDL
jgi:hypothetical protein